jgi:hypothetical protein
MISRRGKAHAQATRETPPPAAFTPADVDNLRAVTYAAGQLLTHE